jgi:hypothetical protein
MHAYAFAPQETLPRFCLAFAVAGVSRIMFHADTRVFSTELQMVLRTKFSPESNHD